MRFVYADPPYLGRCSYYKHEHNDCGTRPFDGRCWNDVDTHRLLLQHLRGFDGFVMSASSPSLVRLAEFIIPNVERIGAWVKPFASFKPGINPGFCWEPVIFSGGRKRSRTDDTVRDYISANIVLQKGVTGAKPPAFCQWVLDLMGFDPTQDEFEDVFVGSGAFTAARDAVAEAAR